MKSNTDSIGMKILSQILRRISKKTLLIVYGSFVLILISSCSRTGIYSVIVSNPGIQHEQNVLNDLGNPYQKKKIVFPSSVVLMSDDEKAKWMNLLNQYNSHTIDTVVKIGLTKTPGLIEVKIPACGKKGIAIVALKSVNAKRKGREIEVEIQYVCKKDNPEVDWDSANMFWSLTPLYKIDVQDDCNNCDDGFQSIEFQFISEKKNPVLRSVLIICAKE